MASSAFSISSSPAFTSSPPMYAAASDWSEACCTIVAMGTLASFAAMSPGTTPSFDTGSTRMPSYPCETACSICPTWVDASWLPSNTVTS
jgi:hypothetical protein